jgi:hypothetical protein
MSMGWLRVRPLYGQHSNAARGAISREKSNIGFGNEVVSLGALFVPCAIETGGHTAVRGYSKRPIYMPRRGQGAFPAISSRRGCISKL